MKAASQALKAAFVKEDNYSRFTALGEVTDYLSVSCLQKRQEAPSVPAVSIQIR